MNRIVKFNEFVNEALGVPTGIIPLSKELFQFIKSNIDEDSELDELDNLQILMKGGFEIADMKINQIEVSFNFQTYLSRILPGFSREESRQTSFVGMSSYFSRTIGSSPEIKIFVAKTLVRGKLKISINLRVPHDLRGDELIKFFDENKRDLIPILAHELKHFYDKFKNPTEKLSTSSEYSTISSNSFSNIDPLNMFLFLSYYFHEIENLVRPTEFAAKLDIDNIGQEEFLDYFKETEIYKYIKMGEEFSLEKLYEQLGYYINDIKRLLIELGAGIYFVKTLEDEDVIEYCLKLFYENLITWKGQMMNDLLYIKGKTPFRFIGKKEKYFDEYLNKILKFGDDYKKFFEQESKHINSEAKRMFKKLSGLYAITDIYGKKQHKTNIWKK